MRAPRGWGSAQAIGVRGGDGAIGPILELRSRSARARSATARCATPATASPTTCSARPARRFEQRAERSSTASPSSSVLAIGASQSAFRLTTYVNDVDAVAQVFDGFLVHACGAGPARRSTTICAGDEFRRASRPVPRRPTPSPSCASRARLISSCSATSPRCQPDDEYLVCWEMAGTSHADAYTFYAGMIDTGALPPSTSSRRRGPHDREYFGMTLDKPVERRPSALRHERGRWRGSTNGCATARGPRPPADSRRANSVRPDRVRDRRARQRAEAAYAPRTSTFPLRCCSGLGNSGAPLAHLCGTTTTIHRRATSPLTIPAEPSIVDRFAAATQRAVSAGHLLPADAPEINALANVALPPPLTNAGRQAAAPRWRHAVGG